jgi:NAD(P) transhydrogenase subunit alpha
MPADASLVYARNVWALAELLVSKEGSLSIDLGDEVISGSLLTHAGEVKHAATAEAMGRSEVKPASKAVSEVRQDG